MRSDAWDPAPTGRGEYRPWWRPATIARAAWGSSLLAAPDVVLHACGVRGARASDLVVRLLGARHLGQALLLAARPTTTRQRAAVLVDALHAVTMYLLAAGDRGWRRAALLDGAVATGWALWTWRDTGRRGEGSHR